MERYTPTLSFAIAAVAIFHQPQGLSSSATASIAQISTALGLFVIGQAAKSAAATHHNTSSEESASTTFFKDIKNNPMQFIRSIPASDVKWTVVTAGVLAGIGLFFDKGIRWNCMKSAAMISLAQLALAKLESKSSNMD